MSLAGESNPAIKLVKNGRKQRGESKQRGIEMSPAEGLENSRSLASMWDMNEIPARFLSPSGFFAACPLHLRCLNSTESLVQRLEKLARDAIQCMDFIACDHSLLHADKK